MVKDEVLNKVLDDILRQVVCDCGNYRHHGVYWMPEGSGEGLVEARAILRLLLKQANPEYRGRRLSIDRPCSACSAGDYRMIYHHHFPPFREGADAS